MMRTLLFGNKTELVQLVEVITPRANLKRLAVTDIVEVPDFTGEKLVFLGKMVSPPEKVET